MLLASVGTLGMAVPKGTAVMDGRVEAGEYGGGFKVKLAEGEIRAVHDGKDLFLAILPRKAGIASVFLLNEGKLTVLHSSAALGSADYKLEGGTLSCARKFVWEARPGKTREETFGRSISVLEEREMGVQLDCRSHGFTDS